MARHESRAGRSRLALRVALKDPLLRYGSLLLLVQVVWRASLAFGSYFWQDDFRFLATVSDGLTVAEAAQPYNGHLLPGNFVLAWLVSSGGTSFAPAATTLVVGHAIAGALMLWVLSQMFRARRVALVGYAVYLVTPLGLVAATWWAYGIQGLPMQIALLGTTGGYLAFRRSRRRRWIFLGAVLLALGLFFYEKAVLAVPLALGVSLLLVDTTRPWRQRLATLRRDVGYWSPLSAITAGYVAVFLMLSEGGGSGTSAVDVADYAYGAVLQTLLPGMLGGPWTEQGTLNTLLGAPPRAVVALCAVAWVLGIAFTVRRRGRAAVEAWALAAGYVMMLLALVVWQRADVANFLARDPRYLLDAVPVVVLSALAALVEVKRPEDHSGRSEDLAVARPAPGATGSAASETSGWDLPVSTTFALVIAVAASSWVTTGATVGQLQHSYSRDYVAALVRAVAAEPGSSVVDAPAPPVDVVARTVREVAQAVGVAVQWDMASTDLRIVDGLGQLAPVGVLAPDWTRTGPTPGCGWPLTSKDSPLALQPDLATPGLRVVDIGVLAEQPTAVEVRIDGSPHALTVSEGVGRASVVTKAGLTGVEIEVVDPGRAVCITEVRVGAPWPRNA